MVASFRVIYNQDCTNLFGVTREPITPEHVDGMVEEVAEGGADLLLINPQAQRTCYPSRVWQTFWEGYSPDDTEFFGPVPEAEIPGRRHWLEQMQRLAEGGCDYLERALARCRERGITPGVTVRMNDRHDQPYEGSPLHSRFYAEHPELRLDNPEVSGWGRTGLNYEHAEVRAHYFALLRELVEGYDFDALELDFMRFTSYFPRGEFAEHAAVMTGWLREVRELLDGSGRPIELIPRVAASPAQAYELGFDVAAWAREGLVDGVTGAAFLNTNWDICVEEFREAMGPGVPVYAGTDYSAHGVTGLPPRRVPAEPELVRGLVAGYAAAGAAGINMFNFFCLREEHWDGTSLDPAFAVLAELGAPGALQGRPKAYLVTGATDGGMSETDRPSQVPVVLPPRHRRDFRLLLAPEPEGTKVSVEVIFRGEASPEPAQLWLHLNAHSAGPAGSFETVEKAAPPAWRARYSVPAAALRAGSNRLMLRNEGPEITVLGVEVRVG